MGILKEKDGQFLLKGEPFRILSGAIHYFRVPPEYWEDRLKKLRACGFNTVETYVCWNLHERQEGKFDFSGRLDLKRFLQTAKELGLYVILRPGPFICAEWEFGGLPAWLLRYRGMHLRSSDPVFLTKTKRYLRRVLREIDSFLSAKGGPVIALQVENEYGSYGGDKDYLNALYRFYLDNGIDEFFFTSDGTDPLMLQSGTLPPVLAAVNFGSRSDLAYRAQQAFQPGRPFFCAEYWGGWFDHWYEKHHTRSAASVIEDLDRLLSFGGSFNIFPFHGGTNFGYTNGANLDGPTHDGAYMPTVTSYDYGAPLSESGEMTDKYYGLQALLAKHFGPPPEIEVTQPTYRNYGGVWLTEQFPLLTRADRLASPVISADPPTMEELGQDFGFLLYRHLLTGPFGEKQLRLPRLHDRAQIFINGKPVGVQERTGRRNDTVTLSLGEGETAELAILVENMGRVNYGPKLWDEKGLLGGVLLGVTRLAGFETYSLPLETPPQDGYETQVEPENCPAFLLGRLTVEEPADTFVRLDGFHRGMVYVNGFALGRYDNPAGPQRTLYLPAPLLHTGVNEITVLELEGFDTPCITLTDTPDLGAADE